MSKKNIISVSKKNITRNCQQVVNHLPTEKLPTDLSDLREEDLANCSGGFIIIDDIAG